MCFRLLEIICGDLDIKQGLYPGCGSNKRKNGKPKTEFHLQAAKQLFEDHPVHGAMFKADLCKPKSAARWGRKIKNQLKK